MDSVGLFLNIDERGESQSCLSDAADPPLCRSELLEDSEAEVLFCRMLSPTDESIFTLLWDSGATSCKGELLTFQP